MLASSFSRYASLCFDSSIVLWSSASLWSLSKRAASYESSLSLLEASSLLISEFNPPWSFLLTWPSLLPFRTVPVPLLLRWAGEFFNTACSANNLSFWFISLATSSDNALSSTAAAEARPLAYELSSASFWFRSSNCSFDSVSSANFCFSSSISLA